MLITDLSKTPRYWFTVDNPDGTNRTGLVGGNFTANLRNPANDATQALTVAESGTAGLYFADLPTAFFTAEGAGIYGLRIHVSATTPRIERTASDVIDVRADALAGAADLTLIKNLSAKDAMRIDNVTRDAQGFMTSARIRIFPDPATAAASTKDAAGAEGATRTITITGAPDGTFPTLYDDVLGVGA